MTRHIIEIQSDDFTSFWASSEYGTILNYLGEERKTLCLIFEKGLKIIDDEEIFRLDKLRQLRDKTTIIIDRNLLISARDIFQTGEILEKRHRFFCALMYYGISIDCLYDPAISLYEGGDRYNHKAIDDLQMFRIIDNLEPQLFMNLLFGEIIKIPEQAWMEAKQKTKQTDDAEKEENYNKNLTLYKYSYPYMLKTAQLMRKQNSDLVSKIEQLLNWAIEDFLMIEESLMISMYCLKENGGIIKKHGSTNYSELIRNIQNAAWDVTMVSYFKYQAIKNEGRYYIFVSEDINLIEAAKYFFDPRTDYKTMFGKNEKKILKMINNANKIRDVNNRAQVVRERIKKIDSITASLEVELKSLLEN
ncbi:MAG: hypothetical protein WC055_05725 [Melioribacteraceae bacterium]